MPEMYPVFLKLEGRAILLVGGGTVAMRKAMDLAETGAVVRVVSMAFHPEFAVWLNAREWRREIRSFAPSDVTGAALVIAATNDPAVNQQVRQAANAAHIPVNAVDDPDNCDFYLSAIVRKGDLRVAISTQGKAPTVAAALRRHLETSLPEAIGRVIEDLEALRGATKRQHPDDPARRATILKAAAAKALAELGLPATPEENAEAW